MLVASGLPGEEEGAAEGACDLADVDPLVDASLVEDVCAVPELADLVARLEGGEADGAERGGVGSEGGETDDGEAGLDGIWQNGGIGQVGMVAEGVEVVGGGGGGGGGEAQEEERGGDGEL